MNDTEQTEHTYDLRREARDALQEALHEIKRIHLGAYPRETLVQLQPSHRPAPSVTTGTAGTTGAITGWSAGGRGRTYALAGARVGVPMSTPCSRISFASARDRNGLSSSETTSTRK